MKKRKVSKNTRALPDIVILAMGKGWMAVDKPAGMTVHNQPGHDLCSRAGEMVAASVEAMTLIGMDPAFGVQAVHRLDKETSGTVLLAVTSHAFRFLARQFESHEIQKKYIAILHGHMEDIQDAEGGATWKWPLAKTAGGRRNPQGTGSRQDCVTRYRVTGTSVHYTLAEILLSTGRKHQIRRHARLAGHPVVGDSRYGTTRAANFLKEKHDFERLGLHALSLTFLPPDGRSEKTVTTNEMPLAMKALFTSDQRSFPSPFRKRKEKK